MFFSTIHSFFRSASAMDWYFFCIIIAFNLAMDIFILQQLPETERTNCALLVWLLVAMTFGAEIWLRLGVTAAAEWATGYGMEVLFSIDTIFVNHILLATLQVPRRLLAKVMLLGLAGSIFFRLMLYSGLAPVLNRLHLLPAFTGLVLVYCGARCMTVPYDDGEEDWSDVMHTKLVHWARAILGKRLCEFYDEDGESLLMVSSGKLCVTLLGVVVACQLVVNSLLCLDVVFAKVDEIPNAYLNFTSSVVALFTVRALFFVARDIFTRFELTNAGSGFVIFFVGVELVVARAVYVSAAASFVGIVVIAAMSIICSRMLQPSFVKAGARLPCSLTC
jgi:tellurite resistance protein TerC